VSTAPASVLGTGSIRLAVNPPDAGRPSVPPLAGSVAVHGLLEQVGEAVSPGVSAAFPSEHPPQALATAAPTKSAIHGDLNNQCCTSGIPRRSRTFGRQNEKLNQAASCYGALRRPLLLIAS
jgi:hypothetical protein